MYKIKRDYKKTIIRTLNDSNQPLDVEKIRLQSKIGNWNTALKHCLELLYEGKIKGQKTSKSWVFWISINKQFYGNQTQKGDLNG